MWIVAGAVVVVVVVLAATITIRKRRSARAVDVGPPSKVDDTLEPVHALDDALRTVESLTDAAGSSLLDQVDREGRTIRDRLASGEAHLDALRQPDDTGPLLRRVLDEVAGADPPTATPTPPTATASPTPTSPTPTSPTPTSPTPLAPPTPPAPPTG